MTAQEDASYWYQDRQTRARLVLEALRRYRDAELAMRERARTSTGLGDNDLSAMRYLLQQDRAGRQVTPAELAEHLGLTRPSVTVMLDRLSRAGYLRRRRAPHDRRSMILVPREPEDPGIHEHLVDLRSGVARRAAALDRNDAAIVVRFLHDMRAALDDGVTPMPDRFWFGADDDAATAVLSGLREYRASEQRMRRRTRDSMRMGDNDLHALRYLLKGQREGTCINAADLASELAMKSSSVTAMLDRLSASGHVIREPHPSDRRSVAIIPTPAADTEVRATLGTMHGRMIAVPGALDEHAAVVVERFLADITDAIALVGADR